MAPRGPAFAVPFGMAGFKDFREIARVAKGSEGEVLNHFIDAVDCGYLSKEEFPQFEHAAKKALKAVNGLIRYLETTPDPPSSAPKKRKPPEAP